MKMTLDDAIAHAKHVAASTECKVCAEEHCQLAEWLEELKSLRQISAKVQYDKGTIEQ